MAVFSSDITTPVVGPSWTNHEKKIKLKGILKTERQSRSTSLLDFTNECRIISADELGLCETISSRRMDRTDLVQDQNHYTLNQHEEDDESYFMAATSIPTVPVKTSKWIRPRSDQRDRQASLDQGEIRGNHFQSSTIQISRSNGNGKCQSNCSGRLDSHCLTRRFLFRLVQVTSLLLIVMGIITLVTPSINMLNLDEILIFNETSDIDNDSTENLTPSDLRTALQQWVTQNPQWPDVTNMSIDNSLLDIPSLTYSLNNYQLCAPTSNSSGIYFLIVIHSAATHFVERQAIRASWGSVKSFRNWSIRLVFLLGQVSSGSSIQEGILEESDLYGDIVAGNFDDTYRNLTYKHLMGYKWVLSHCPMAKFIIKTDDDAFIDIFQVFDFVQRNYGLDPSDILLCNIYPEGTKPVRKSSDQNPIGFKWIVTKDEYPFESYPKYCGGLGYLATVDVIRRLNEISNKLRRFLWIDDVFVTGVIRELAVKEPFYLNLRYSYDEVEYRTWLDDRNPRHRLKKLPYMFVHVPRGGRFDEDMARLWRKTVRAWS